MLYVLATVASAEGDLLDDLAALRAEVAAFDPSLAARTRLVVLNKADLTDTRDAVPDLRAALADSGEELLVCSAATGEGLDALKAALIAALVARAREDASSLKETPVAEPC